jgi:hypothetical protein
MIPGVGIAFVYSFFQEALAGMSLSGLTGRWMVSGKGTSVGKLVGDIVGQRGSY